MRSLLKNSLVIVLILSAMGCRKDTPVVEPPNDLDTTCHEEWCNDIPPENGIGYQYVLEGPQYMAPSFNPNNSNEFVYLRTGTAPVAELVKYDLSTNMETVLCNSENIASPPKWGKQGWITFATIQKKVWKVNEDGSQLTQLTFGVNDFSPHFNFNGDRIFYLRHKSYSYATLQQNPELYKEYKMMVIDLMGNEVDSVMATNIIPDNYYQDWVLGVPDESDNVYFVGGSGTSAGIYKISNNLDSVYPGPIASLHPDVGWVYGMAYINERIYFSRYKNSLYEVDVVSNSKRVFRIGCDTRFYKVIDVSSEGNKMIVEKQFFTLKENMIIDEQHEIWLLNLDNSCEMVQILGE